MHIFAHLYLQTSPPEHLNSQYRIVNVLPTFVLASVGELCLCHICLFHRHTRLYFVSAEMWSMFPCQTAEPADTEHATFDGDRGHIRCLISPSISGYVLNSFVVYKGFICVSASIEHRSAFPARRTTILDSQTATCWCFLNMIDWTLGMHIRKSTSRRTTRLQVAHRRLL